MIEPVTREERVRKASSQRREQEKENLRQAIMEAASKLLLEQGYDGFSLRQVAERIGYSATTIYLYFKDKDELVFSLIDEVWDQFGRELEQAAASVADPIAQLRAIGHAYFNFGLNNPVYYQLMFMQRCDFLFCPKPNEELPRIASFVVLTNTVQAAIDAGALKPGDVQVYSLTAWSMVHGLVSLWISMPQLIDEGVLRGNIDAVLDIAIGGLLQRE